MIRYTEILRLYSQGLSQRTIASSTGHSRQIVKETIERAELKSLMIPLADDCTDFWLHSFLFPEKTPIVKGRKVPDFEYVHKELARAGVTLSLLWEEYRLKCVDESKIPYSYRQFCRDYNDFAMKTKATLRIKRKPGEILEVDWAGETAHIYDEISGEMIPAFIFVATLPCSQYTYAEAFLSMDSAAWISAHIHALDFFGGTTQMIVPDNLRTGVDKAEKYSPIINRSYQEFAEHYRTIIVPARVGSPKDKPSVEGNVGHITTWIIASLRNEKFFTLRELNEAIQEKLFEVNTKPFQKLEGCRLSAFEEEEKFALMPLPLKPFELSSWKTVTVPLNYHIESDKMLYSVPYEYVRHKVEVRQTTQIIEIFFKGLRVASHKRIFGKPGQMSTQTGHMPTNHQHYVNHTPESSLQWAKGVGFYTEQVVNKFLINFKTTAQAMKACMGLMKLEKDYQSERLENACEKVLGCTSIPELKTIKLFIALEDTDTKGASVPTSQNLKDFSNTRGFTRGADYYGGLKS